MKFSKISLFTLAFLVSLSLSCNFLGASNPTETTRRVNPLEEANGEGTPSDETLQVPASLPTGLGQGLETLTSYQTAISLRNSSGSFTMTTAHNASAQHVTIATEGINIDKMGATGSVDMYETSGNYYLEYSKNGSWLAFPTTQTAATFVPSYALGVGLVGGLPTTAERAETPETVNGVPTYRYDFTNQPLQGVNVTGQMWLGSTGYVVKLTAKSDDGTFNLAYDLTQINSEVAINLPEAAKNATFLSPPVTPTPAPNAPSGEATTVITATNNSSLPVMPNAENLTSTATSVEYLSSSTLAAVSDFYTAELEAQRWRADKTRLIFETARFEVGYQRGSKQYIIVKGVQQADRVLVQVTLQEN